MVSAETAEDIARAVTSALPREACGFLLGVSTSSRRLATEVVLSRASSPGWEDFAVPDFEVRRIRALAEGRGLTILALLHSHPSGDPRLSAEDRASLCTSAWPWVVATRAARGRGVVLTGYEAGRAAVALEVVSSSRAVRSSSARGSRASRTSGARRSVTAAPRP